MIQADKEIIMAEDESLFTNLDKKAEEAQQKQKEEKQKKINEKVEKAKKGESLL